MIQARHYRRKRDTGNTVTHVVTTNRHEHLMITCKGESFVHGDWTILELIKRSEMIITEECSLNSLTSVSINRKKENK